MTGGRGIRTGVRRLGTVASIIVALVLVAAVGAATAVAAKRGYHVKVVRSSAGIPHITASNFRSLGYGEGFSYAQDNACLFEDAIVTVRGERTQFFGADGSSYYYSNGSVDPNPKSDAFWKWVRATNADKRVKKDFGKDAKGLYRGWVAGFNAYLRHGHLRDPACKGEPWVRPIKFRDMLLRGLQIEIGASSGVFISDLFDAQPPAQPTASARRESSRSAVDVPALKEAIDDETGDSDLGSNGLAFGREATKRRGGLLLANPHFPWRGVDRFWMAHLTVRGDYDVMGGTLGGFPMIGVGFNKSMAWTHTVSTGRRFIVRQLELAPGDPTSYVVDGQAVPMTRTTVNVGGEPHTFYGTRYGLVITIPEAGYGWTTDTAYALTDTNLDNSDVVNQYLDMGRAKSVKQLLEVERKGRGVPFFNTIASDRKGNALYADVGRYSNVPASLIEACTPDGLPKFVYAAARLITLDGARSECDPDGNLPASAMPHLIRRDYVENSNDSFWLANPKSPITGITPLIGLDHVIQGIRTRSGNLMVQSALDKGRRFAVPSLQRLWENDHNYLAALVSGQLADLCRANPQITIPDGRVVDVTEACPILDAYDNTGNLDSKGAWLFAAYTRRSPSGAAFYSDAFDPANPLTTPNQLDAGNPQQVQALGQAVQELRDHGVPLDSGMRGVQVATRGKRRISIHGCANCFQNINSSNGEASVNAPYGEVVQGSSMVLTTELTKKHPRAEGILTYSQATDPTSPWFANMTKLFSKKKWVKLAFTKGQERKDRHRTRVHLPDAHR